MEKEKFLCTTYTPNNMETKLINEINIRNSSNITIKHGKDGSMYVESDGTIKIKDNKITGYFK
jgi:hypothetical protein